MGNLEYLVEKRAEPMSEEVLNANYGAEGWCLVGVIVEPKKLPWSHFSGPTYFHYFRREKVSPVGTGERDPIAP